jgi:hypothetical protein
MQVCRSQAPGRPSAGPGSSRAPPPGTPRSTKRRCCRPAWPIRPGGRRRPSRDAGAGQGAHRPPRRRRGSAGETCRHLAAKRVDDRGLPAVQVDASSSAPFSKRCTPGRAEHGRVPTARHAARSAATRPAGATGVPDNPQPQHPIGEWDGTGGYGGPPVARSAACAADLASGGAGCAKQPSAPPIPEPPYRGIPDVSEALTHH